MGLVREWGGKDQVGDAMRGCDSGLRKEKPMGLGSGPSDWTHMVPDAITLLEQMIKIAEAT